MKITVSESVNGVTIEESVTILYVQDFDAAAGAIPLSLIEAAGDLIVGTSIAEADVIHAGNTGDVLTMQSSGLPAFEAPSGGVANALDFMAALTTTSGSPYGFTPASTVVYLTPNNGNKVGIYGTSWERYNLTEISIKLTDAQNGNTTNGSKVITGLTDTSQLIVGMEVTGTGIAASSTIASIDSATQVTLNNNATANGTGVALTFKVPISTQKIFLIRVGSNNYLRLSTASLTTQDGVLVKDGDATWRYCGCVVIVTAGVCERIINQYYQVANIDSTQGLWPHQFEGSALTMRYYRSDGTEFEPSARQIADTSSIGGRSTTVRAETAEIGDYYTLKIPLITGTYTAMIQYTKLSYGGKFDVVLDGIKQTDTSLDVYKSTASYNNVWTVTDITVTYNGIHEFKIANNGTSVSDYGSQFGGIALFRTS